MLACYPVGGANTHISLLEKLTLMLTCYRSYVGEANIDASPLAFFILGFMSPISQR